MAAESYGVTEAAPYESVKHLAECLKHDPEIFFPPSNNNREVSQAKSVCQVCPIMTQCLD